VPIIPIVVYHGKERWWVALTHGALFDGPELLRPYWPEYRYEVTDVSHLTVEEVRGAILTQVALRIMRSIYDTRQGEDLSRITEPMIGMVEQETVPELLKTLLVYVLDANEAVTMAELKTVLRLFARAYLGHDVHIRFRPSFFPFTEPSVEVDMSWNEPGKPWLEIGGAGMVDPHVLSSVGYDPDRVSGFAFGLGVERFCMRRFGIRDIRLFTGNDLQFLRQF
jgi:hypothetical protein